MPIVYTGHDSINARVSTNVITTQNILQGVSKMASEAVGPVACLRYSVAGSRPSNRLG